ncbi:MAG: Ldh family oxidoreductase [Pirellulales bacterium]
MPVIPASELRSFAVTLLRSAGLSAGEAELVGGSLVDANLRGHDSHGVMRIPFYLDAMKKGEVVAGAAFTVCKESETLINADGNWGFGQTLCRELTERVCDKALEHGVGVGTLIRSSHIGRLGEYCEMAASRGLVSLLMVNTHGHARRVAPPGGKAPRLGTNPLAFGVPTDGDPLVLDFGTSAMAEGKVRVKKIAGQQCPPGWLLDSDGKPTTDPNSLYGTPPGTILPMGGDQAYKGFALGLIVEIFAGALRRRLHPREAAQSKRQLRLLPGDQSGRDGRRATLRRASSRPPAVHSRLPAHRRLRRNPAARRSGMPRVGKTVAGRRPVRRRQLGPTPRVGGEAGRERNSGITPKISAV